MKPFEASPSREEKPQGIITLTKAEVDALKDYCDENLAIGNVIVFTKGPYTKVQVEDLPETLQDITDSSYL